MVELIGVLSISLTFAVCCLTLAPRAAWVSGNPWNFKNERNFALRHGSVGTHGVNGRTNLSLYVVGFKIPTVFLEYTTVFTTGSRQISVQV